MATASRPEERAVRWMIVSAAVVLATALGSILFVSNYYNYAAESISLSSLLRMAAGRPYVGRLDELPLLWNPYSPYLAWLLAPVLRFFHWSALEPVALAARLTVLAVFAIWVRQLARFVRESWPGDIERRYLAVAVLWVMLLFTVNMVAIRPDLPSFLAEFMALVTVHRATRLDTPDRRLVVLAGVLAGVAIGVKLNTVGGAAGIALFLVVERRHGCLLIFTAAAAVTAAAMLALEYAVYGSVILEHIAFGLQSRAFHGVALARRMVGVVDEVFVINLPFILFAGWGLAQMRVSDRRLARRLACFIAGSICAATFGQSKIGAASNYYIGAFMVSAVPVAIGLRSFYAASTSTPGIRVMRAALYFTWAVLLLKSAALPVTVFANDWRHYPYADARALIAREYPGAVVYATDENATLQLRDYTPLGPWSESLLSLSDGFAQYLPAIRQRLEARPFTLAVTTGTACDQWRPGGLFEHETAHLRRLAAKLDKICVFAPDARTPSRPVG